MHEHLQKAHFLWRENVKPGDLVIDATCGNGHDTLLLAQLALTPSKGTLFALDVQEAAIIQSSTRLREHLPPEIVERVVFLQKCHSRFPESIEKESVTLIVYNLGYLPGGNKALTTLLETTQKSLFHAMELIAKEGLISVMCYPGHAEGKIEEDALLSFASCLNPLEWKWTHQRLVDRPTAPSLLIFKKSPKSI